MHDRSGYPQKLRSAVPGRILGKTIVYLFLSILAVVTLFPIFYALMASFKSNMEILTGSSTLLPTEFHFENYSQAWSIANFGRYTWNSVYLAFFTVLGAIVGSTMGGYVFARGEFPGKKLLFGIITSTMFISLGSITLFPLAGDHQGAAPEQYPLGRDCHQRVRSERHQPLSGAGLCDHHPARDRRGGHYRRLRLFQDLYPHHFPRF